MPGGPDGILQLLEDADSLEDFLRELDTPQRKYALISSLDEEGRRFQLESGIEFTEIDSLEVGVARKLHQYLHRDPPEERHQKIPQ